MFVNAINKERLYEVGSPPLNLAYLAAALRKNFDKDTQFKIITSDFEKVLDEFDPDVVGISSVTQNYNTAMEYAKIAKGKGKNVLMGGVHISALPQTMTDDMDISVLGEGEETIVEIFKNDFKNLEKINGIAYRKDGKLVKTAPRELIKDLDTIAPPARDLLKINKYTYMFTSRGCPYRCIFCSSSRFWNKVRFHSADRVIEEIKFLIKNYGVEYIEMYDDLFIADKQRIKKIAKMIKEQNIKIKIGCSARANMVDDETMKLLKEIGVKKIVLGLESGNERILTYLKGIGGKSTVTVKQNYEAVRIANKYGILVNAGFVIGSPDETEEEIMDTYKLAATSGVNHFETYILTPLPGTPVWELAKKKGFVNDTDFDWSKLDIMFSENYENAIVMSDTLSREKLYDIYKRFKKLQFRLRIKSAIRHPIKNNVLQWLKKIIFEGAKI